MKLFNALLALTVVGCSFEGGSGGNGLEPQDGSPPGGSDGSVVDSSVSNPDAAPGTDACSGVSLPFEADNLPSCALMGSNGALDLSGGDYELDTDTGVLSQNGGAVVVETFNGATLAQVDAPSIFAVVFDSITIDGDASLTATGSAALALVATGNVAINGLLSVGAEGETPGAGGNHAASCAGRSGQNGVEQADDDGQDGGSGGGGGGFGTTGGTGARVNWSADGNPNSDSAGGDAIAASFSPAIAGCPGGEGGSPFTDQEAGGGGGGGGLEIHAAGSISIGGSGAISAHGGGGLGVNESFGGGGGGGSGGSVFLQATAIENDGLILALGGAGGEGSRLNSSSDPGEDGHSGDENAAQGGAGGSPNGGDGGDGGVGTDPGDPGNEGDDHPDRAAGGGGGGGGVGQIRLVVPGGSPTGGGDINPPAS